MASHNLEQLIATAKLLQPLLAELVFVGGSVTGLMVTDEAAGDPRTTFDVDVIVEITCYAKYAAFGERLRALGFTEDTSDGAPLCRWFVRQPSWTSCRSTRRFSDFQIAGIAGLWKPQPRRA